MNVATTRLVFVGTNTGSVVAFFNASALILLSLAATYSYRFYDYFGCSCISNVIVGHSKYDSMLIKHTVLAQKCTAVLIVMINHLSKWCMWLKFTCIATVESAWQTWANVKH